MSDYAKIVSALRLCMAYEYSCPKCPYYGGHPDEDGCADVLHGDAANAIEELIEAKDQYKHAYHKEHEARIRLIVSKNWNIVRDGTQKGDGL